MKTFALVVVIAVPVLTLAAALNVVEGYKATAIGAAGLSALLIALCLYALADIRAVLKSFPR
jgi:hypothetical protein